MRCEAKVWYTPALDPPELRVQLRRLTTQRDERIGAESPRRGEGDIKRDKEMVLNKGRVKGEVARTRRVQAEQRSLVVVLGDALNLAHERLSDALPPRLVMYEHLAHLTTMLLVLRHLHLPTGK